MSVFPCFSLYYNKNVTGVKIKFQNLTSIKHIKGVANDRKAGGFGGGWGGFLMMVVVVVVRRVTHNLKRVESKRARGGFHGGMGLF